MTGIKVISVTGKYAQKNDPQMTCSKLEIKNTTFGKFYSSAGKYTRSVTAINPEIVSRTEKSPVLGKNYTITTGQTDYVGIDPGFSGARLYYTVKRMTSSYTASDWIAIDFGSMPQLEL